MNRKTVGFTAPLKRAVLDDPHAFGALATMLMMGARGELEKACEGRAYEVQRVHFGTTVNGPSSIRDLLDAQIEVTVTVGGGEDDASSSSPSS